jgi:hypothetical protein
LMLLPLLQRVKFGQICDGLGDEKTSRSPKYWLAFILKARRLRCY